MGLVWVHDYQLMLTPESIRRELPETPLAFFLHIPFPPFDIFRLLPWDRELLRALLACDLIGFHIRSYAHNFIDCAERSLGARVHRDEMLVEYGDRTTRVSAFPIGIEFGLFESLAVAAPKQPETQREQVVLGVDRLDYTKGIPERIQAFERLLERHPEHREKVVLLQLAVPSRAQVAEYRELKRELDEIVGRVNGRFATADWSPIRYLYRAVTQERLCALYRDADVALVTPLRDGMNLVAKEFIACQVNDPGVLVLSRLAGAADTMREALLVNPYDIDGTAEAIHRALTMDDAERRSRVAALRRRERRDDVYAWVDAFLEASGIERAAPAPLTEADFSAWLGGFLQTYRLALFVDYDGTLCPLAAHPSQATLSHPMSKALEACAARDDTDVAVVSGRALEDVRSMVNQPALIFAGNHGLEIAGPDIPYFVHEDLVHYRQRAGAAGRRPRPVCDRRRLDREQGPHAHLPLPRRAREPPREPRRRGARDHRAARLPAARRSLRGGGAAADRLGQGARRAAHPARPLRAFLVRGRACDLRGRRPDRRRRIPLPRRPGDDVPRRQRGHPHRGQPPPPGRERGPGASRVDRHARPASRVRRG